MTILDYQKNPILFSAGTKLSYRINRRYYNDIHYVWCTNLYHSKCQPPTSDPQSICNRFLQIANTGDRHANEIEGNKAGILKGADEKRKKKVISDSEHRSICEMVNAAIYSDFTPVLYIISGERVREKCREVDNHLKASDTSAEWLITELSKEDFQLVDFSQVIRDMIDIPDRKAGE